MPTDTLDETCPFVWGDKVNHRLFGLGKVNGEPVVAYGPDTYNYEVVSKGWSIPVEWEDVKRPPSKIGHDALRLVVRPDAKEGAYWHNEFNKLHNEIMDARKISDTVISKAYRATTTHRISDLNDALKQEKILLNELISFLNDDKSGKHE